MNAIQSLVLGSTFYFAREKAAAGDDQSTRDVKPATTIEGDPNPAWVKPGRCSKVGVDSSFEFEEEQFDPVTGELEEILRALHKLTIKFTIDQGGPLLAELLFHTAGAVDGDFGVSKTYNLNGWCKWQGYHRGSQKIVLDLWCDVQVTTFEADQKQKVSYEITCKKLRSSENGGTAS